MVKGLRYEKGGFVPCTLTKTKRGGFTYKTKPLLQIAAFRDKRDNPYLILDEVQAQNHYLDAQPPVNFLMHGTQNPIIVAIACPQCPRFLLGEVTNAHPKIVTTMYEGWTNWTKKDLVQAITKSLDFSSDHGTTSLGGSEDEYGDDEEEYKGESGSESGDDEEEDEEDVETEVEESEEEADGYDEESDGENEEEGGSEMEDEDVDDTGVILTSVI